jgi:hypothetical protein
MFFFFSFLSFFSFFLLLSFAFIRFKLLCCALLLPLLVSLWLFFYKWSPPPQAKGHWKRAKA